MMKQNIITELDLIKAKEEYSLALKDMEVKATKLYVATKNLTGLTFKVFNEVADAYQKSFDHQCLVLEKLIDLYDYFDYDMKEILAVKKANQTEDAAFKTYRKTLDKFTFY
ncbi:hypothetical protein HYS94_02160 [Candidatus Daviesbacteria bacterium]|nr:hypothetical protein [Candidatus Daviesbacteria bacterium]